MRIFDANNRMFIVNLDTVRKEPQSNIMYLFATNLATNRNITIEFDHSDLNKLLIVLGVIKPEQIEPNFDGK